MTAAPDALYLPCDGPVLAAVSFASAILAEFAGAALGFGPAILYEISWQLCAVAGISDGQIESAIWNIIVAEALCSFTQLILLRKHFRLRLFVLFNLPMVLMLPVGTQLLGRFGQQRWAKRALGVVLLTVAAVQAFSCLRAAGVQASNRRDLQARGDWRVAAAIAVAMGCSGLLRGFLGVAGPPVMVLLLFFHCDRSAWRCVGAASRVMMILLQGVLLGVEDYQPHCWRMYSLLAAGGLVGMGLGNLAAPHIDGAAFQQWLIILLVSGALLMLSDGNAQVSILSAVGVGVAAAASILMPAGKRAARLLRVRGQWREGLLPVEVQLARRSAQISASSGELQSDCLVPEESSSVS
ncbi:unnamed protein product [Polarella glacialis]|uniref:Uncharacterized protein n=1 Tax=Polarella glacialis TaxID=89957 RepID=A0A813L1B1_POLGL|nr:unnamed protein product [Polarella glacialis]